MTVYLRFLCGEIVGSARPGAYHVEAGSTVAQLMAAAAAENRTFREGYLDFLLFQVNGRFAAQDCVLHEGDRVTALRLAYGG